MLVDLLIVAFVGILAFRGWRRGVLLSLSSLLGFAAAAAASVSGYRALAPVFRTVVRLSPAVSDFTAAATIFVGVSIAFRFFGRALTRLVRPTKWGTINRAAGAALSCVWALSWTTALLLAVTVIPAPAAVERSVHGSDLAREILREAPRVATTVARADLRRVLQVFVPSELRLAVHATKDFSSLQAGAGTLFNLVNRDRRAHDLAPLSWDARLADAARRHAADMYAAGYFAHTSPDGLSPADRLRELGIPFRVTAENIALAPVVSIAHARMMASPPHSKHILSALYTRIGVGAMFGPQGIMVDEEFAG